MKRTTAYPKKWGSWGNLGGYTLIEALIVVAVSSTIFIGITTFFAGSRENVDFNQAKTDIDTKLKAYVNEVSTGVFAGSTSHSCAATASGGKQRPLLTAVSGATPGTSDDCVYLGKAVLAYPGATDLYIYDILGLRNKYSGSADTGQPARSFADANPEPAGENTGPGAGTFNYLFVETYRLPAGLRVGYAQTQGNDAHILKIYSSLSEQTSASRTVSVFANSFTAAASDVSSNRLRDCIHQENGVCTTVYDLQSNGWDLCFQNEDNSRRAKLNIKPTSNGIVSKLIDGTC